VRERILFHVLVAKFGQSLELKEKLLETLDAYLLFRGNGSSLGGANVLGKLLMKTREYYGGLESTPQSEKKALKAWEKPDC